MSTAQNRRSALFNACGKSHAVTFCYEHACCLRAPQPIRAGLGLLPM